MTKTITTASGRTRELPAHVDPGTVIGLDQAGRIVVLEDWMNGYAFGLTLCCDAWDKGAEDGIVCRSCYSSEETGHYMFLRNDGTYPGLDPVVPRA